MTGQQGSRRGRSVWVLGGSQTGQRLLLLRAWDFKSTGRAHCRGLFLSRSHLLFSVLSVLVFSSSLSFITRSMKTSCIFCIREFDPTGDLSACDSSVKQRNACLQGLQIWFLRPWLYVALDTLPIWKEQHLETCGSCWTCGPRDLFCHLPGR